MKSTRFKPVEIPGGNSLDATVLNGRIMTSSGNSCRLRSRFGRVRAIFPDGCPPWVMKYADCDGISEFEEFAAEWFYVLPTVTNSSMSLFPW